MPIVAFPGGQAELRDKPTVGGRELLQQEGFNAINLLSSKMPDLDIQTIGDLQNIPPDRLDGEVIRAFNNLNRAGVVAFVKSWTLGPNPTMESVSDLETDQYDALVLAVAPLIVRGMFGQDFSMDGKDDPNSPTAPSPDSSVGSRAVSAQSMSQTPTPSNFGANSGIDDSSDLPIGSI